MSGISAYCTGLWFSGMRGWCLTWGLGSIARDAMGFRLGTATGTEGLRPRDAVWCPLMPKAEHYPACSSRARSKESLCVLVRNPGRAPDPGPEGSDCSSLLCLGLHLLSAQRWWWRGPPPLLMPKVSQSKGRLFLQDQDYKDKIAPFTGLSYLHSCPEPAPTQGLGSTVSASQGKALFAVLPWPSTAGPTPAGRA